MNNKSGKCCIIVASALCRTDEGKDNTRTMKYGSDILTDESDNEPVRNGRKK